jgi:hypothetical protein
VLTAPFEHRAWRHTVDLCLHQQTGDSDAMAEGGDWRIVMREVSAAAVIKP